MLFFVLNFHKLYHTYILFWIYFAYYIQLYVFAIYPDIYLIIFLDLMF